MAFLICNLNAIIQGVKKIKNLSTFCVYKIKIKEGLKKWVDQRRMLMNLMR